jgi:hypothetical protein
VNAKFRILNGKSRIRIEWTALWESRIAEIRKQRRPRGIKDNIIDVRDVKVGKWSKAVFYYVDGTSMGNWDMLLDTGSAGLWLKFRGDIDAKEEMLSWIVDIARAYRSAEGGAGKSYKDAFYTRHGVIPLEYIEQESTYARWIGNPLQLKLEIEINETHVSEPENEGLMARTSAAMTTGFASGVDIKRLRSHKRKVAGLDGEEEVDRMKSTQRTMISYAWRYPGKVGSGRYPEILISMESPDGDVDDKLDVWDAILDSVEPINKN